MVIDRTGSHGVPTGSACTSRGTTAAAAAGGSAAAGDDSAEAETAGWDAQVAGALTYAEITRESDGTTVTITLAARARDAHGPINILN